MKVFFIVAILLILLIGGSYFYTRHHVLKAKDYTADNTKSESIVDLRPSIIAKLQQLIKDGSNGLYRLSIDKIEPDILSSTLDVYEGTISADSTAMRELDREQELPDDIFKIKFHTLHISGFGIQDLLHSDKMDVANIHLTSPVIQVYHRNRNYNEKEKKATSHLTIYQRLKNQLKKIAIDKINITDGKLIVHDAGQNDHTVTYNDISINMSDVLMDSSTQFDSNRFLFAKHARLETKNYSIGTPDSLYRIKLGSIVVSSETKRVTITNAELKPIGNKKQFEKKLPGREEMYHVTVPKIVFSGVDWWSLLNRQNLFSKTMNIEEGSVNVYFNKSLPLAPNEPMNHFPHQLVMMIPYPVLVDRLNAENLKIVYTQYNPETRSTGTTTFTNVSGHGTHITNMPDEIRKSPVTDFSVKGLFMGKVPLTAKFKFDLAQWRIGQFSADVHMDALNKELVNPVSEPLGRFTIKSGQMQKADAHLTGNNSKIEGTIAFYYNDLHITPLREDSAHGELKRNHVKSFFANWLLIKNANPDGKFRSPGFLVDRDSHQNFIAFIWMSIMTGILKTIGVPPKLVLKEQ